VSTGPISHRAVSNVRLYVPFSITSRPTKSTGCDRSPKPARAPRSH